jgi:hypothetical protein
MEVFIVDIRHSYWPTQMKEQKIHHFDHKRAGGEGAHAIAIYKEMGIYCTLWPHSTPYR